MPAGRSTSSPNISGGLSPLLVLARCGHRATSLGLDGLSVGLPVELAAVGLSYPAPVPAILATPATPPAPVPASEPRLASFRSPRRSTCSSASVFSPLGAPLPTDRLSLPQETDLPRLRLDRSCESFRAPRRIPPRVGRGVDPRRGDSTEPSRCCSRRSTESRSSSGSLRSSSWDSSRGEGGGQRWRRRVPWTKPCW